MTRVSENTVLLSSEVSEVDIEDMEYTENESDKSSIISNSELQEFSGDPIIQGKTSDIESINFL